MKIEKINDRQIRCVLTKEDLESRKIRLSELVCGGEKARGLLRDMVIQAARELNFSFNNNPLMIEAVPTGKDQLVLIITRVDDPGELKSRFHQLTGFGESGKTEGDQKSAEGSAVPAFSSADDILNLLRRFSKQLEELKGASSERDPDVSDAGAGVAEADGTLEAGAAAKDGVVPGTDGMPEGGAVPGADGMRKDGVVSGMDGMPGDGIVPGADGMRKDGAVPEADRSREAIEKEMYRYTRFYLFRSLEHVLDASKRVPEGYSGENTLYKNPDDGAFYLLVRKADTDAEQFNRICNVLSEYSMPMDYSSGMDEFFREHMRVIVADSALQHLREV
jgi:adapter protein MecA 1/2